MLSTLFSTYNRRVKWFQCSPYGEKSHFKEKKILTFKNIIFDPYKDTVFSHYPFIQAYIYLPVLIVAKLIPAIL